MQKVTPRLKKKPKFRITNLRNWRIYRGLSQDQLVARCGEDPQTGEPYLTKTSLSRLETGNQPYSEGMYEVLAHALQTTVAQLLDHNPRIEDPSWTVYEAVRALPRTKQADIARMVKAIPGASKTGTSD